MVQQEGISRSWTKQINLAVESVAALTVFLGILGVAAIPTVLMSDIRISVGQFALYNLVFIIALLFCSLPSGLLAHKFGGKKVVSVALVIVAISDVAFGGSGSFLEQLIFRAILGVGACAWWVSAPENLVLTFGKRRAALPLAIWLCGYAAGAALSYPIMVLGATTIGWRVTYQILGIGCLVVAILYIFAVKVPRSPQNLPTNTGVTIENNIFASHTIFSFIPHERSTILLSVSIFFQYLTWVGVLTFFPLFLADKGFGLVLSGLLSFGLVVSAPPSMIFGGLLAVKLQKTVPILLLGLALLSTVLFLPFVVPFYGSSPLLLFVVMGAIGIGLAMPDIAWTFLSEVLPISGQGSVNFAFVNVFGFAGSMIGAYLPPLIFALSSNNWTAVWIAYSAFCLISFSVATLLRREEDQWLKKQNQKGSRYPKDTSPNS